MSRVVSVDSTPKTSNASPLICSYAISNLFSGDAGATLHTCPMLFVTVHVGVQTYASSHPSSLCVTMIRVAEVVGDHAIRTARIGPPAVAFSASPLHVEPSHVLFFGLLSVFVPVFERYPISASTESMLSRYWTRTPSSAATSPGNVPPTIVPVVKVCVAGAVRGSEAVSLS